MSCSFRLRTTRPDGRREDLPLDDLLDSPEFEDALLDGLKMNGLLDITETPDGEDGRTLSLKAKFKGFEPQPIGPGELLGVDGFLGLTPDGVDGEGDQKYSLSATLNDNPGVAEPIGPGELFDVDGLLGIASSGTTPGGADKFSLSATLNDNPGVTTPIEPGQLLGVDGFLGLSPNGVDSEGNAKFALSATLNDNPGVVTPITGEQLLGELEYTESERVVEQVVVGTAPNQVTIDRMVSVTFLGPAGGSLRLIFDNPE